MRFRWLAPRPALASSVRGIWALSGDGAEPAAAGPVPPDGCVEIVFNFGDPMLRVEPGRAAERQPRGLVVGELFRPVCVRPAGRMDLVGVRFAPGRGGAFLDGGGGLGEVVGCTAALDEICRPALRAAARAVFGIASVEERVERIQDGLEACLAGGAAAPERGVASALGFLESRRGAVGVEALAARAGVSARQLERRFVAVAGATPKAFAQVFRFQEALRQIGAGARSFAHVASACGYFDQAHLVRDFKRYTTLSPRAYLGAEHPLADRLAL